METAPFALKFLCTEIKFGNSHFLIRILFQIHANDFEISNEYAPYFNWIGIGMNININIWCELYLSLATKFAVYYSHTARWLTGLKYCMQNAANTDSTVKKNLLYLHYTPISQILTTKIKSPAWNLFFTILCTCFRLHVLNRVRSCVLV